MILVHRTFPSVAIPKPKFLTIPLSAGSVGGAGKKWKGKFLVLISPLHSSRKDLYLYFSIMAIFCPSFPPSFASVRGAPISEFGGSRIVRLHFTNTSHKPSAFAHDVPVARHLLHIRSVASFESVVNQVNTRVTRVRIFKNLKIKQFA